jgi:hypothetical protein
MIHIREQLRLDASGEQTRKQGEWSIRHGARCAWDFLVPRPLLETAIARVAWEALVAAIAGEGDVHVSRRHSAQVIGWDAAAVGHRLVEKPRQRDCEQRVKELYQEGGCRKNLQFCYKLKNKFTNL